MRWKSGWGSLGGGCGERSCEGSWSWGGRYWIDGAPTSAGAEEGLAEGGPDSVSVGFFLASRVSCMDRLSFLIASIASESKLMRAWRSLTAFVASPLRGSLVRVGAVGDGRGVE